jgi:hypothetical protein
VRHALDHDASAALARAHKRTTTRAIRIHLDRSAPMAQRTEPQHRSEDIVWVLAK